MDPRLACSGPMSTFSYDSHPVSRRRIADELPRVRGEQGGNGEGYSSQDMDLEIQRVARELYKAFSGLNEEFERPQDQVVIDTLSAHTDSNRQELIHPYKTLYGRDLNSVLKDNLGDSWEEACVTLMTEMRMYELECLRRRMEDEVAATQAALEAVENDSLLSPAFSSRAGTLSPPNRTPQNARKKNGSVPVMGRNMRLEEMLEECAVTSSLPEEREEFSGHSCLLVTWKTNPEVEQFKELYMEKSVKTHKRKNKQLVDPGDLVSDKSLSSIYQILGKGEGTERLLVKGKKEEVMTVDGDQFRYFLLAGTSHPYPDDTFYSVGRVPRKLLMKYLGVKMYLVRLREPPQPKTDWGVKGVAGLVMGTAGITSPIGSPPARQRQPQRH